MIRDTEDVVARAIALREECRKGVEERGVMPDYCDACIALKALAPKLLDAAQSLSDRIDVLEGEKRSVEAQRRELQMLLVRHGDHEAIKKAGGTHLGSPGDCNGPPMPSQPHPHARDMIA